MAAVSFDNDNIVNDDNNNINKNKNKKNRSKKTKKVVDIEPVLNDNRNDIALPYEYKNGIEYYYGCKITSYNELVKALQTVTKNSIIPDAYKASYEKYEDKYGEIHNTDADRFISDNADNRAPGYCIHPDCRVSGTSNGKCIITHSGYTYSRYCDMHAAREFKFTRAQQYSTFNIMVKINNNSIKKTTIPGEVIEFECRNGEMFLIIRQFQRLVIRTLVMGKFENITYNDRNCLPWMFTIDISDKEIPLSGTFSVKFRGKHVCTNVILGKRCTYQQKGYISADYPLAGIMHPWEAMSWMVGSREMNHGKWCPSCSIDAERPLASAITGNPTTHSKKQEKEQNKIQALENRIRKITADNNTLDKKNVSVTEKNVELLEKLLAAEIVIKQLTADIETLKKTA